MYKNLLTILLVYTTGLSLQAQNPIIAFPSITVDESEEFDIDVSIFYQKEDIEISSHYLKSLDQLSFNFSISFPFYKSS
mgnify:CR=1 FL=1